jgi:hypothetical protein
VNCVGRVFKTGATQNSKVSKVLRQLVDREENLTRSRTELLAARSRLRHIEDAMGGAILPVVPTIEQSEILEQDVKNLNDADDAVTAVMEKAELERAVHRSDREMLVLAANRHACPEQANYGEDQTAWSDTQTANAQTIAIKALQQKANAEQALRRMHRRVNRLNHDKAMVRSKARTALRRHGLRHFEEKMRQVLADIQQTNLDIESIKRSQKQAVNAYRTGRSCAFERNRRCSG